MSADRWSVCPACKDHRRARAAQAHAEANAAYGKASIQEFDRLRAEAERLTEAALHIPESEYTFREDFGFSSPEDEEIQVTYHGRCTTCGLTLKFEHTHPLPIPATLP